MEPGVSTSFQYGGRQRICPSGRTGAGAADTLKSLRHANLLGGTAKGLQVLEMTLGGLYAGVSVKVDAVIAFAGGCVEVQLDDMPLPMYQSVQARAGQGACLRRIADGHAPLSCGHRWFSLCQ